MPRPVLLFALTLLGLTSLAAAEPKKYALFVAVTTYEHADMNRPALQFPEADAKALAEVFRAGGYEADLLFGEAATQAAVRAKLAGFADRGNAPGVVVLGVFGHGFQPHGSGRSYFCPYDTPMRPQGADGTGPVGPVPNRLVSVDELLAALRASKAGNRLLLADCCRNDPTAARGLASLRRRSFGTELRTNDLPNRTAMLLACSEGEEAFELRSWGHGAFTKVLLDKLAAAKGRGRVLAGSVAEEVEEGVTELVGGLGGGLTQTPKMLITAKVELKLGAAAARSPFDGARTLAPPPDPPPTDGMEGTRAGQPRSFGEMRFRWCPLGSFIAGSPAGEEGRENNEDLHEVTLSRGFWMSETEVTQGEYERVAGMAPWRGRKHVKEGARFAASYISWEEAKVFAEKLTQEERQAGRLPSGWRYALPREA